MEHIFARAPRPTITRPRRQPTSLLSIYAPLLLDHFTRPFGAPLAHDVSAPPLSLSFFISPQVQLPAMEPSPLLGASEKPLAMGKSSRNASRKASWGASAFAAGAGGRAGLGRPLTILIVDDSELNRKVGRARVLCALPACRPSCLSPHYSRTPALPLPSIFHPSPLPLSLSLIH